MTPIRTPGQLMRTIADPAVLASLTGRLERMTADHAPRWGRMTAHQMLAHVAGGYEAVLQRGPFEAPPRTPNPVIKFLALYTPLPWPRGIVTGADPAGRSVAAADFEADRRRTISTLAEVAAAPAEALVARHPMFGPMTRRDWHRWAFLHGDHHLRQFGLR